MTEENKNVEQEKEMVNENVEEVNKPENPEVNYEDLKAMETIMNEKELMEAFIKGEEELKDNNKETPVDTQSNEVSKNPEFKIEASFNNDLGAFDNLNKEEQDKLTEKLKKSIKEHLIESPDFNQKKNTVDKKKKGRPRNTKSPEKTDSLKEEAKAPKKRPKPARDGMSIGKPHITPDLSKGRKYRKLNDAQKMMRRGEYKIWDGKDSDSVKGTDHSDISKRKFNKE